MPNMRVATCGDCIHADVCEHNPNIPLFNRANAAYCVSFKDRKKYVEVVRYKALIEMYHELRENFVDYYCSGIQNVAPYCLNRCEECVDKWGWCKTYSDKCKGFNPAEVILDGERKDNERKAD